MTQTVTQAVARRESGPQALIKQYSTDFASVLPSHIKAETWVRLAQGALKRGKKVDDGRTELEVAAGNNPGVFLAALLDAARLGLEPGTEQYYLTPRKVKGKLEILGIVGYQGHIELMYRAGAVSSIIAEVVREHDDYRYQRGVDMVPVHTFKPFAREADRGGLVGVYAYARMKDGSVSRVIELNQDDIDRAKKSSQGSDSEYSPWVNFPVAMWLKTSVRQLQKWVPTSAEYRREQLRAVAEAQSAAARVGAPAVRQVEEYVDGEVIEDHAPQPEPTGGREPVRDREMFALLKDPGRLDGDKKRDDRLAFLTSVAGRPINSSDELTAAEVGAAIAELRRIGERPEEDRPLVVAELVEHGRTLRAGGPA